MFYVKGKSHLLHILPTDQQEEEVEESQPLKISSNTFSSAILHSLLRYFDLLPTFLMIASSMSLLAYVYTLLLLPTVFTASLPQKNATDLYNGTEVPIDIGCPFLTPRAEAATNVHDLRPDDIKLVIGLGDSVMAGFAAKGIQDETFFTIKNLYENRGISFAMGGVKY